MIKIVCGKCKKKISGHMKIALPINVDGAINQVIFYTANDITSIDTSNLSGNWLENSIKIYCNKCWKINKIKQ